MNSAIILKIFQFFRIQLYRIYVRALIDFLKTLKVLRILKYRNIYQIFKIRTIFKILTLFNFPIRLSFTYIYYPSKINFLDFFRTIKELSGPCIETHRNLMKTVTIKTVDSLFFLSLSKKEIYSASFGSLRFKSRCILTR